MSKLVACQLADLLTRQVSYFVGHSLACLAGQSPSNLVRTLLPTKHVLCEHPQSTSHVLLWYFLGTPLFLCDLFVFYNFWGRGLQRHKSGQSLIVFACKIRINLYHQVVELGTLEYFDRDFKKHFQFLFYVLNLIRKNFHQGYQSEP